MGMNKTPLRIVITDDEREQLQRIARSFAVPHRDVVRAQIILHLADGLSLSRVASEVRVQRRIVRKWATRFIQKRLLGLADAKRSGRPARFSPHRRYPPGEARV